MLPADESDPDAFGLEPLPVPAKKRRIQRACDSCRQKRRACDGLRAANKKCKFCIDSGVDCVYSGAPIATTKRQSYTEQLEARVAQMEKLLRKVSTDATLSEKPEWSKNSPILTHATQLSHTTGESSRGSAIEVAARTIRTINEPESPRAEEDMAHLELMHELNQMTISNHNDQFLGPSSGAMLFRAAADLKDRYAAEEPSNDSVPARQPWASQRMEYWIGAPWKAGLQARSQYDFPPADVLTDLVNLYFMHSNVYIPLLHRPTFERGLAERLHFENDKFGAIVILVCAVASRFSDNPRVVDVEAPLMCGWKYFAQLSREIEYFFEAPVLYDLQRCCLTIQFLEGSAPKAIWQLIGIGIRIVTEVGAHRRQVGEHTIEAELWRRAFWALVFFDRVTSCQVGRPCGIQHEEYDVQMPTECDDEYWEEGFRQPPGVPSRVKLFTAMLRLNNILAICLRFVYSLDKAKRHLALQDKAWEEHLVAELDSALNTWVDSIPEHLRWDPDRSDPVFFNQSVALYCSYYWVQMTIHRPFIPTVRKPRLTALPSLAICTNAARSCANVAEAWSRRNPTPSIILLPALTTAGVVLLLNVWSGRRTGLPAHMNTSIAEARKCKDAVRMFDERWQMAGIFWDILEELAQVGNTPLHAKASSSGSNTSSSANASASSSSGASPSASLPPTSSGSRKRARAFETGSVDVGVDDAGVPWDQREDMHSQTLHVEPLEDDQFAWLGDPNSLFGARTVSAATASSAPTYPTGTAYAPHPPPWDSWTTSTFTIATPAQREPPPNGASGDPTQEYELLTGAAATETGNDPFVQIDGDALAMWMNAPTSLGVDDWGTYFNVMSQLDQQNSVNSLG